MSGAKVLKFPGRSREVEGTGPQVDDGYTRIANELLDVIAGSRFSQRQFQVLLAVVRKTYGFRKKSDRISDSQLAEATGLSRSACCDTRNELLVMGVLIQAAGPFSRIGLNKDYASWKLKQKRSGRSDLSCSPDNRTTSKKLSGNSGQTLSENSGYTKEKRKITQDSTSENPESAPDSQTEAPPDNPPEPSKPKDLPDAAVRNKSGTQWGTAEDLQLAEMMATAIDRFLERDAPPRRNMTDWANAIRLMREQDNRKPEHIQALFAWAHQHHFWKSNILSPAKLREKWPQLGARRKQEREEQINGTGNGPGSSAAKSAIARQLSDPEYAYNNF